MQSETAKAQGTKNETLDFIMFLIKLVIFFTILRTFIISPFNIPSESMMPRLVTGDYILVTKWSYGYSRYSLPYNVNLIPGRIFASSPKRGDVVVFKPPGKESDVYIKRLIGLPGDSVQMKNGQLFLNGKAVKKQKLKDFVVPVSPNTKCMDDQFEQVSESGSRTCHYPQYRETLPNGRSYKVLDLFHAEQHDNTQVWIVPEGKMFLMGDNRDNSADSRFDPVTENGIGMVPQENLVGKALVTVFSTDGSASWLLPWTWFTAARFDRVGEGFLMAQTDSPVLLEDILDYKPQDTALFRQALTHGSLGEDRDYQRLEFLGDRVLGMVIARHLFVSFPNTDEGKLSAWLNRLVSRETCANIARECGISTLIRMGRQARDDGGTESTNILGDVIESLIGALYCDGGLEAADRFITTRWKDRLAAISQAPKHPKSALQEWAAAQNRKTPEYKLIERTGPHHAPRFTVEVSIHGIGSARASGSSKQEAETEAARLFLQDHMP